MQAYTPISVGDAVMNGPGLLEVDCTSLFAAMLAELRSHRERLAALETERPGT